MRWMYLLASWVACGLVLPSAVAAPQSLSPPPSRSATDNPRPPRRPQWLPPSIDLPVQVEDSPSSCTTDRVLAGAGAKVQELVDVLRKFTAVETDSHERLTDSGKVRGREIRTSEYVLDIVHPQPGIIYLEEFHRYVDGLQGGFSDGIGTNGMLTLAFVFHPEMQDFYTMSCEGLGSWKGQPAWIVKFHQRPDRPMRQLGYRVGNEHRLLGLKGRAWIAAENFQILHMEAELIAPEPLIELWHHFQMADYGPVRLGGRNLELWLPQVTQTFLQLRKKRYRISSRFSDFQLFEVEVTHREKLPEPQP